MALLVLIVLGATIGWLASILARTEAAGEILRQMGAGIVATLIVGIAVNGGTVLGSLTLIALGSALAAGVAALVLYHGVMGRRVET
ncbi:hypothetical protein ACI5KX_00820 [Erythrobacter sp. GH1-10]|uniref:hypothetical protein n=1 Tax=Erythrobacter sp. GH1-10 TaxID=3349334 RepID=UPI0038780AB9